MRKLNIAFIMAAVVFLFTAGKAAASSGGELDEVDASKTAYSRSTPAQVSVTLELPEDFSYACSAEVLSRNTGTVYKLPLITENGYYERCFVPEGTYCLASVYVVGDNTGTIEFELPEGDFEAAAGKDSPFSIGLKDPDYVASRLDAAINGKPEIGNPPTDFSVEYDGEGYGRIGVTGENDAEYNIAVKIIKSGFPGDAKFAYTTDGISWSQVLRVPLSGVFELGTTGLTLNFDVPMTDPVGFISNDFYYCHTSDPLLVVSITHSGLSSAALSVESMDDRSVYDILVANGAPVFVKINKSGGYEAAVWQISIDGGAAYSEEEYAVKKRDIPEIGIRLVADGGAFTVGDVYTIKAEAPKKDGKVQAYIFFLLIGGAVVAAALVFTGRLKAMKPRESDYRVNIYYSPREELEHKKFTKRKKSGKGERHGS